MVFVPMTQLETERLLLRKFQLSDLESHHRHITSDPEVAKTMLWQANPDPAHAEQVLKRILAGYETGNSYRWAIVRKVDDAYLGTVSLLRLDGHQRSCAFAYMLGKAFWNRGYMTEALKAVLRFAFETLELDRVETDHFLNNPASGAVMGKAGMKQVGVLPGRYEKDGVLHDAVLYRMTKEDWQKAVSCEEYGG